MLKYKYIDVSKWQGRIDWERVKQTDVAGVIIRAGYGQGHLDETFVRNIEECNRLGIPCGIYWFGYAYSKPMALNEALYALNAVKPYRLDLPIAYDWEYDSERVAKENGVTPTATLVNTLVKTFCDAIEDGGYYAMNYTNLDFLGRYMTDVSAYDLWLAQWGGTPATTSPSRTCGIWQYGGTLVDGIGGYVDTNVAYRDYPTLIKNAGLNHLSDPEPEPEPPAPPEPWYAPAMRWASEQGICDGTRPEEPASRAEVAQMLMNYHNKTK